MDRGDPNETSPQMRSSNTLEKSQHLRNADRPKDAERIVRQALSEDPQNSLLHAELAEIFHDLNQLDAAKETANTALRLDPTNVWAHTTLARCEADSGQHQQAEKHLLEALRLNSEFQPALLDYALLNLKVGEHAKAESLVKHALLLDPENSAAHQILSLIQSAMKNRGDAALSAGKSLQISPDEDFSHFAAAYNHLQSGRPFKARRHFREARRLDPTDSDSQEMFLIADLACRWLYLPMYFFSLFIKKIPGSAFTLWFALIAVFYTLKSMDINPLLVNSFAFAWLGFVIYSWTASPITKLWTKIVPPR